MSQTAVKKYTLNKGLSLWLTGLSGSGKSTIAYALYKKLSGSISRIEVLDGDAMREHINKGLGFTKEDRLINIERNAYIAGLLSKHGILVIVPVIAPYKEARAKARSLSENFVEVFVKADIETVKERDVKGLYKKAIAGEIENFTGISDPYEEPENPEILINTDKLSIEDSVQNIIDYLIENDYIS